MTLSVGDIQARAGLEDDLGPGLEELSKKVEAFSQKLEETLSKSAETTTEKLGETRSTFDKLMEGVEIGAGIEIFNTLKEKVSEVAEYFLSAAEHAGQFAEQMEKLGARTGMAAEEVAQLSEIGKVADVSVDSMAMAMNRMQRSVEAGSKGAIDGLKKLHLGLNEFREMKTGEQFEAILDGLERIPEGAQRTTIAMELLSRTGPQMLPLVGHVKELSERIEGLGITMTGPGIAAASAFDDKMDILGLVMDSFREKIGVAIAQTPGLGTALDKVTDVMAGLSRMVSENAGTIQTWVMNGITLLQSMATEGWAILKPAIEEVKVALEDMWERMGGGSGIMQTLTGAVVGLIKVFAEIVPAVTSVVTRFLELDNSTKLIIVSLGVLVQMGGGVSAVFTGALVPAFNSAAVAFADFAFWMAGAETITIPGIVAGFATMAAAIVATGIAALEFGHILVTTGDELRQVNDPVAEGVSKVGALTGAWVIAKDAASGLASVVKDTLATAFSFWSEEGAKASGVLKLAFEVVNISAMPLKVTFETLATAASYFSEKLDVLSKALYNVNPSGEQLNRMNSDIAKANTLSDHLVTTWEEAARIIGQAGKALQDAKGIGVDWNVGKSGEKPSAGAPPPSAPGEAATKALEAYNKEVEKLEGELAKMGGVGQDAFDKARMAAAAAYDAEVRHVGLMKELSAAQRDNLVAGAAQLEEAKLEQISMEELAKQYSDAATARKSIDEQLTSTTQKLTEAEYKLMDPLGAEIQKNQDLADKTIDAVNAAYAKIQATGLDTEADLANAQAATEAALALRDFNNEAAVSKEALAAKHESMEQLKRDGDDFLKSVEQQRKKSAEVWGLFADDINSVLGLLYDLGGVGDVAGDMLEGLAKGMDIAAAAAKQGYLSISQMAQALGDMYKTGAEKGAGAGAMSGAMQGASIGALFGPMGAAAGAVAGGLMGALGGIFGKPEWKKVGENAGKILGYAVGDETAKALSETMSKAGVSMEQAILLNLDRIAADTGKTMADMSGQVLQLINTKFAAGSDAAKKQAEQISKAWGEVRSAATQVGDAMTVAMLKSAEAAGTMTAEMKDFVSAQQDLGASGAKRIAEGLAMIKPENLKNLGNFGAVAAGYFTKGFQDAIDKEGLVAALDDFGDGLTSIYEQMQQTFPSASSSAILAPFVNLKNVLDEDDGTLKGMITTVEGMGNVLESQANRGLFDPSMQAGMGDALDATFEALKAKTGDAKVSMQSILPELSKAIQASQQLGVPLDANTARLKQTAEDMHFAFPAEPIVQLVDLMKTLVTGLGFALPQNAQVAARAIDTIGKTGAESLETAAANVTALGETTTASFTTMGAEVASTITDTLGQSIDAMGVMAQSGVDASDTVSTAWNGTVSKIGMFVEESVGPVSSAFQELSDESSAPLDSLLAKLNGIAHATGSIGANANSSQTALANIGSSIPGGGSNEGKQGPDVPEFDEGGDFVAGIGRLPRGGSPIVVHPGEHVSVSTASDTAKSGGQLIVNHNPTFNIHGAGNDEQIIKIVKHHLVNDQKGLRQVIKRYASKN